MYFSRLFTRDLQDGQHSTTTTVATTMYMFAQTKLCHGAYMTVWKLRNQSARHLRYRAEAHKSGASIAQKCPRHASKSRRGGYGAQWQTEAHRGWHGAYAAGGWREEGRVDKGMHHLAACPFLELPGYATRYVVLMHRRIATTANNPWLSSASNARAMVYTCSSGLAQSVSTISYNKWKLNEYHC